MFKKGGVYFKVRESIHVKYLNFVVFSFQVTINNFHYGVKSYTFQNYYIFFSFLVFAYLFHVLFLVVTVRCPAGIYIL